MKFNFSFIFIGTIIFFASCVSNKKILYIQGDYDLYGPAPKDSILNSFNLEDYEYRLQHEDAISINISSLTPDEYDFFSLGLPEENLNIANVNQGSLRGYLIDENGNIEFPVVGKVKLGGLTIYEAENKIQEIANDYLEEPVVRVRILNFRFSILGEVNNEKTVNTYNNRISIMEAIGLAGGMGELADRANVKVIRQHNGVAKVHYLNLLDQDLLNSSFYYIHQNDVIVVPPLKQRPFRNYFGENLALIVSSLSLVFLVLNLIAVTN